MAASILGANRESYKENGKEMQLEGKIRKKFNIKYMYFLMIEK